MAMESPYFDTELHCPKFLRQVRKVAGSLDAELELLRIYLAEIELSRRAAKVAGKPGTAELYMGVASKFIDSIASVEDKNNRIKGSKPPQASFQEIQAAMDELVDQRGNTPLSEAASDIAALLNTQSGELGTSITPDAIVNRMDGTIPLVLNGDISNVGDSPSDNHNSNGNSANGHNGVA